MVQKNTTAVRHWKPRTNAYWNCSSTAQINESRKHTWAHVVADPLPRATLLLSHLRNFHSQELYPRHHSFCTCEPIAKHTQLKDKIHDTSAEHEANKKMVCTQMRRRAGGLDQVKPSLRYEEMAKTARRHDHGSRGLALVEPRICWENCGTQSGSIEFTVTPSARMGRPRWPRKLPRPVAEETGWQIERIRWLSKATDKISVVMFLTTSTRPRRR